MSDHTPFGFGKFIPGFDFLQNLGKASASPAGMPPMSHWVAPTVSVEEINKRIEELKAVQFWLEQNSRALTATVQALEVQKMTLNTLQGMNVSMADLAKTFTGQASAAAVATSAAAAAGAEAGHAGWPMHAPAAAKPHKTPPPTPETPAESAGAQAESPKAAAQNGASAQAAAAAGLGDPMLWWNALSQQFQQIAGQALQDPAQQQAMNQAKHMASDFTKAAMQAASDMVRTASEGVQAASASVKTPTKAAKAKGAAPTASTAPTDAPAQTTAAAKKTAAARKTAAPAKRASPSKAPAKKTATRGAPR